MPPQQRIPRDAPARQQGATGTYTGPSWATGLDVLPVDEPEKQDTAKTEKAPPQASALERGISEFYEKSPLGPAVGLVKGVANVIAHPIDTAFGLKPLAETATGLAKAQFDQFKIAAQKAREATTGPTPLLSASEAVGHGLAGALPLIGPAAADVGEHFGQGDIAGGFGGALGLLAPFAAKYGIEAKRAGTALPTPEALKKANLSKADLLKREAIQQVSEQVLAPGNPRYKGTAAKIAPEVLSRKMQGTRLELQRMADDIMAKATDSIDTIAGTNPRAPVTIQPVIDGLNKKIDALKVKGKAVPGSEARIEALEIQRDFIDSHGKTLAFEDVRKLRQILDQQAAEAKVYERAGNDRIAESGRAAAEAASEVRQVIAKDRPDLVGPNADYTLGRRLADVLDPALGRPKQTNYVPSGVTGGMTTAGAVIGQSISNVPGLKAVGAVIGAQLLPKIKAAMASPEWQLAKASDKMALAEAIEKGQGAKAQFLLMKIAPNAPRTVASPAPTMAAGTTPEDKRKGGR